MNQKVCVYAQSKLFQKIVDFAAFSVFAAIRHEFAFCTCMEQVKLINLGFICEKRSFEISPTKLLRSSLAASQTADLICTSALLGKSVKGRESFPTC